MRFATDSKSAKRPSLGRARRSRIADNTLTKETVKSDAESLPVRQEEGSTQQQIHPGHRARPQVDWGKILGEIDFDKVSVRSDSESLGWVYIQDDENDDMENTQSNEKENRPDVVEGGTDPETENSFESSNQRFEFEFAPDAMNELTGPYSTVSNPSEEDDEHWCYSTLTGASEFDESIQSKTKESNLNDAVAAFGSFDEAARWYDCFAEGIHVMPIQTHRCHGRMGSF